MCRLRLDSECARRARDLARALDGSRRFLDCSSLLLICFRRLSPAWSLSRDEDPPH